MSHPNPDIKILPTDRTMSTNELQEVRLNSNDLINLTNTNQSNQSIVPSNDIETGNHTIVLPARSSNLIDFGCDTKCCSSYGSKCFGLLLFFVILGIVGGAITYIVFVIISLCRTSYNEQKDLCEKSNAWLYLLLGLILNTLVGSNSAKSRSGSNSNSEDKSSISCGPTIQILTSLSFMIWGCIELFGTNCVNELDGTLLYTMLQVAVYVNIVLTGIMCLAGFVTCGLFCCAAFNR
jgi:uncharacterized membrane protein YuzA (DUF378 family)